MPLHLRYAHDMVTYYLIMLAAQTVTTYLCAEQSLGTASLVGVMSILSWVLVLGLYQRGLRRNNLPHPFVEEPRAASFRTIRRRALSTLNRKRRRAAAID